MSPSAAVVGAGAIGGWIADGLDRAGWQVSVLARGETLRVLRDQGLEVERGDERRRFRPRCGSAAELGPHDHVFLAVKAQALPQLAAELTPLLGVDSSVISAINGIPWWFFQNFAGPLCGRALQTVDPGARQQHLFPYGRTIGAVVHASARVAGPAQIQVVAADRLLLGQPDGGTSSRLDTVTQALRDGGINAQISPGIRLDVWAKLWGNMNMNPVSALTRSGTARMLASAEIRELCMRMMEEMQECGRRLGLTLAMSPQERIAVTQRLGDFRTSMLADLDAGRPLELDPQLGAVVEIATLLEVPAPFMRTVLGLARLL